MVQQPAGRVLDGSCGATPLASAGRNRPAFRVVGAAEPTAPHARTPAPVVRQQGTRSLRVLCAAPRPPVCLASAVGAAPAQPMGRLHRLHSHGRGEAHTFYTLSSRGPTVRLLPRGGII
jgi:hypothetical protein